VAGAGVAAGLVAHEMERAANRSGTGDRRIMEASEGGALDDRMSWPGKWGIPARAASVPAWNWKFANPAETRYCGSLRRHER
jgi:hypothetical protein